MTIRRPARVLVVDDDPLVHEGFRQILGTSEDFRLVDAIRSGEETLERILAAGADVAVVGFRLEAIGGVELIRRLKESRPDLSVLVLSMHTTREEIEDALAAGADSYVLKTKATGVILNALEALLQGEGYLCDEVLDQLRQGGGARPATEGSPS